MEQQKREYGIISCRTTSDSERGMAKSVKEEKKASYRKYVQNKTVECIFLNTKKSNNKKDKKTTKRYLGNFVFFREGRNGNVKYQC
jgi:hypothetical protein